MPELSIAELSESARDGLTVNRADTPTPMVPLIELPQTQSNHAEQSQSQPDAPTETVPHGRFIGVGVGPGDPELLTLKALRLIASAPIVSYLANADGESQAKNIASEAFDLVTLKQAHIAIPMPMSTDRQQANLAYDSGAKAIGNELLKGQDVVFLCEGDPLFFGSFSYLLERLAGEFDCQIVPGISSIHAASAALKHPLSLLQESFCVVSGRHADAQIHQALLAHDTVVIMKAGQARPRILALLAQTERLEQAQYLEYIGRENEYICTDVEQLSPSAGPYFSLFVVTRMDRNTQ